jgi:hypothetical protein
LEVSINSAAQALSYLAQNVESINERQDGQNEKGLRKVWIVSHNVFSVHKVRIQCVVNEGLRPRIQAEVRSQQKKKIDTHVCAVVVA